MRTPGRGPRSSRAGNRSRPGRPRGPAGRSAGRPGTAGPSRRATLSNASPAASSTVAPNSVTRSPPTCGTSSSDECPPDTSSATHGSSSGPCSSRSTATCADRWLTPYSGLPSGQRERLGRGDARPAARRRARARPSPRPRRRRRRVTPAVANARRSVGTIACRCARLATSGTTPPKRACSSTLLAMASASSVVPRTMPDPGLVARGLDTEDERLVRVRHASPPHPPVRTRSSRGDVRSRPQPCAA